MKCGRSAARRTLTEGLGRQACVWQKVRSGWLLRPHHRCAKRNRSTNTVFDASATSTNSRRIVMSRSLPPAPEVHANRSWEGRRHQRLPCGKFAVNGKVLSRRIAANSQACPLVVASSPVLRQVNPCSHIGSAFHSMACNSAHHPNSSRARRHARCATHVGRRLR